MKKVWRTAEELNETVPEMPKGFEQWCVSEMDIAPIYYRRNGKFTDCTCGNCGDEYVLFTPGNGNMAYEDEMQAQEIPSRDRQAECKVCGKKTVYEWKKVIRPRWDTKSFYLIQRTSSNDLVLRIFNVYQKIQQGIAVSNKLVEEQRHFFEMGRTERLRSTWDYRTKTYCMMKSYGGSEIYDGPIYSGYQKEISRSNLKYCDVPAIDEAYGGMWGRGEKYRTAITAYANNPAIEMYCKMGMNKLLKHLVNKGGIDKNINRRADTMQKQLRIKDKRKIKRLVEAGGDIKLLDLLQFEEKNGMELNQEQEEWILQAEARTYHQSDKVRKLLKYMSVQKTMNRVQKYFEQEKKHYRSESEVMLEYADYISLREELGYNMENEVFLHPKSLHSKHNEMVREKNLRNDDKMIAKKKGQYPKIEERYMNLCKRYQEQTAGYLIRPAKDAGEIIMEGRLLHHCVGGDNYLSKHNSGASTILFLRRTEDVDDPYITIEIKGTEIVQWYGIHDTKPDKDIIEQLLQDYTKQLDIKKKKRNKKSQKQDKVLNAAG